MFRPKATPHKIKCHTFLVTLSLYKITDLYTFSCQFLLVTKRTLFFLMQKKLVYYYYWLQKCTLNVTPRRLRKNSFLPINYIVLTHAFKCQQFFSGLLPFLVLTKYTAVLHCIHYYLFNWSLLFNEILKDSQL